MPSCLREAGGRSCTIEVQSLASKLHRMVLNFLCTHKLLHLKVCSISRLVKALQPFHKSSGLMIHGQILNVANPLPLTCKPAPKRQEQLHEIPLQINALRAWPVGLGCNWVCSLLKGGIPRSKTIYPSYEYSATLHPLITVDHVGWNLLPVLVSIHSHPVI